MTKKMQNQDQGEMLPDKQGLEEQHNVHDEEFEGAQNAEDAIDKVSTKPSRARTRTKPVGSNDGHMDRSDFAKEQALAQVQQESKALHDR